MVAYRRNILQYIILLLRNGMVSVKKKLCIISVTYLVHVSALSPSSGSLYDNLFKT